MTFQQNMIHNGRLQEKKCPIRKISGFYFHLVFIIHINKCIQPVLFANKIILLENKKYINYTKKNTYKYTYIHT